MGRKILFYLFICQFHAASIILRKTQSSKLMTNLLDKLTAEQRQTLHDAIPNVILLIANADGKIDPKEIAWGEKITNIRAYSFEEVWQPYYEQVSEGLSDRLQTLLNELPTNTHERQEAISTRLAQLNDILPLIDRPHAASFYQGLLTFAERIAKADGGFFGWLSIGPKEKEAIQLPMVNPVA